jgi:hypothetical protein
MKKVVTLFIFFLFPFLLFSQHLKVEAPANEFPYNSDRWGNDIVVLDSEPIGGFYGIQKANGTIYAAINDTLSTPNLGLVIMTSTNRGDSWQMYPSGIALRDKVEDIKMVRSGLDSIYCFFRYGVDVYCWNIERTFVNSILLGNYRTYDAVASSTGNLYVVLDSLPTNAIIRYGSTDGGSTWISRGLISTTAAHPKISMSTSGDTLVLNYYGPVLEDTATSVIRNAKYRETGAGTMTTAGSFTDIVPAGEAKLDFRAAFRNGEIFFAYTKGTPGSRDIYYRKSLDAVTFSPEEPMINSATRDEYWFDIKSFKAGAGGFDVVYYSDSTSAVPTAATDKLFFSSNNFGLTTIPMPGTQINEFPLEWSAREYPPKIVELYFSADDCGVLYVANTGGSKKVFWDYLTNIIPVELTSFTAAVSGNSVVLNWSTSTETNNKGFEVERSAGNEWKPIGYVEGNGTTTEIVSYTYSDNTISNGLYSYRLKQIDFDGSVNYSPTVEVEVNLPDEFSLSQNYPNPFNPNTRIKFQIPENRSHSSTVLKVFDVLGNEVAVLVNEIKPAGSYEIDFNASALSSGMYFYELRTGDLVAVRKMTLIK